MNIPYPVLIAAWLLVGLTAGVAADLWRDPQWRARHARRRRIRAERVERYWRDRALAARTPTR